MHIFSYPVNNKIPDEKIYIREVLYPFGGAPLTALATPSISEHNFSDMKRDL